MNNSERIELLRDAQEKLSDAIRDIEDAIRGTQNEARHSTYIITHLKTRVNKDHGYCTMDENIDDIIEELESEE